MMSGKILFCIFVWSATLFVGCNSVIQSPYTGQETVQLDLGCNITRKAKNSTFNSARRSWFDMPLPHLDCSGLMQTRFQIKGVVGDAKGLSLSDNDFIEFYIDDLELLPNLTKIKIKSNKIQRINPSKKNLIFEFVKYLSFAQNQLTTIPNEALRSFPSLTMLVLSNNKISIIQDNDFRFNHMLNFISLGYNPIKTLEDKWMETLNIFALNMRACQLKELPKGLANMTKLVYGDFSDNNITSLRANSFSNCTNLSWLEFASNKIKTIERGAFKGANKLATLDISDNKLETLTASSFEDLSEEYFEVNAYENPLNCNCTMKEFKLWIDDVKSNDPSFEIRYSCKNPMRNHGKKSYQLAQDDFTCKSNDKLWSENLNCIQPTHSSPTPPTSTSTSVTKSNSRTCPSKCTCWDENQNIYYPPVGQEAKAKKYKGWMHWLRSSYPRVDCIDAGYATIPHDIPENVQSIIMSGNRITELKISELKKFTELNTLLLKNNKIRKIIYEKDVQLNSLRLLNLGMNNISSINKFHLYSFKNLEILSLQNNQLTTIAEDLFANNRKITRLYIGPNPVTSFKEDFMKTLSLKSLSLRNLSLTAIPSSISKLVNLTYIDLSDNQIKTVKNSTFSECTSLVRVALDNNQISTVESNAFNGAISLFSIDITENKLSSLPANVFSNVSKERLTVELWENQFICNCNMKKFKSWIEQRELDGPMTEIRFKCEQPMRMHGKKSDQLTADDFICKKDDILFISPEGSSSCASPNSAGIIVLSVILTFILTLLFGAVIWRCAFRRRYSELLSYAKHRNQFDDLEELQ